LAPPLREDTLRFGLLLQADAAEVASVSMIAVPGLV
jgi:hypothetical protein